MKLKLMIILMTIGAVTGAVAWQLDGEVHAQLKDCMNIEYHNVDKKPASGGTWQHDCPNETCYSEVATSDVPMRSDNGGNDCFAPEGYCVSAADSVNMQFWEFVGGCNGAGKCNYATTYTEVWWDIWTGTDQCVWVQQTGECCE